MTTDTENIDRTNTVAGYEACKADLRRQLAEEKARHDAVVQALRQEYAAADEAQRQITAQLDGAKILLAEHVIAAQGRFDRAGEDREKIRETVIADLLGGGIALRAKYFGTKSYDRWHGQGIECEYGMVPRHGSVIFRIEMARARRESPAPLSSKEIEAAVYYLRALELIQRVQNEAEKAAEEA